MLMQPMFKQGGLHLRSYRLNQHMVSFKNTKEIISTYEKDPIK